MGNLPADFSAAGDNRGNFFEAAGICGSGDVGGTAQKLAEVFWGNMGKRRSGAGGFLGPGPGSWVYRV